MGMTVMIVLIMSVITVPTKIVREDGKRARECTRSGENRHRRQ
jgi:hypothetical protein